MADRHARRFANRPGAKQRQTGSERGHKRGLRETLAHKLACGAGRRLETFANSRLAGKRNATAGPYGGGATGAGPITSGRGSTRRHSLALPRNIFSGWANPVHLVGPARA